MMRTGFHLAMALLIIAGVAGTLLDRHPERPVVERAGYRVLQADFHAHTRMSDGVLSPQGLVLHASRRGLDVVAVTEHNMTLPGKMARWFSELIGGPLVLVSQEVTSSRFHLHGVGIEAAIDATLPLSDVIDQIHAQGGVAIAAHPTRKYWQQYAPVLARLDGTEVAHPMRWAPSRRGWAGEHLVEFYDDAWAKGHAIAPIGSSDYHFFSPLGVVRTWVFVERATAAGVLDAIRAGRTVTRMPDEERWYGPPELVQALKDDPVPANVKPETYNYGDVTIADAGFRWMGLLGLLGLVFLSPRPRSTRP